MPDMAHTPTYQPDSEPALAAGQVVARQLSSMQPSVVYANSVYHNSSFDIVVDGQPYSVTLQRIQYSNRLRPGQRVSRR